MWMRVLVVTALLGPLTGCGGSASRDPSQSSALSSNTPLPDGGLAGCDCSGMTLPDVCQMCSDPMGGMNGMGGMGGPGGMGGMGVVEACAHFACIQGACVVEVCP